MTTTVLTVTKRLYPAAMPNTAWCALDTSIASGLFARHQEGPP